MIRVLTFFALIFLCQTSFAFCVLNTKLSFQALFPEVLVQRDAPVGAVLAEYTTTGPVRVADCTGNNNVLNATIDLTNPSTIPGVYETNLPGVGVSVFVDSTRMKGYLAPSLSYDWGNFGGGFSAVPSLNYYKVSLIKTGEVTAGTLSYGVIAHFHTTYLGLVRTGTPLSLSAVVKKVACAVKTNSVNVSLGDILTSKFSGIGSTVGEKPFTIALDCDPGTSINISLEGTQNTDVADNTILSLSYAGSPQVADGVGVQILNNETPLKINERVPVKTATQRNEELNMKARYYQTKTSIKGGLANASATLNISYQ